jgi:large subunit ribosomal protein L23Ae
MKILGKHIVKKYKIRKSVTFRRPRTQELKKAPKYKRKSHLKHFTYDSYSIIKYPLANESAIKTIEDNNTLVFIVDIKANKKQIKKACKELYNIQVKKVNTLIR